MSQQPNEEERQEITEAKTNSNVEEFKAGLAAILMAIAFICGLNGTWAAATSHYTTLSVAIIVGIVSVGLAAWLGWPPKKIARRTTDLLKKAATLLLHISQSPPRDDPSIPPNKPSESEIIQAEYDRLAQEHVRTKLELERFREEKGQDRYKTTELQHDDSVDETIPRAKVLDPNAPVYPPHFFDTGYGDLWTEYTEEVFSDVSQDILWRWGYNKEIDQTPRSITPCCLECIPPTPLEYSAAPSNERTSFFLVRFRCPTHYPNLYKTLDKTPLHTPFGIIRQLIERRLKDGSWVDVVNRQRMARYQAPIGGPIRENENSN